MTNPPNRGSAAYLQSTLPPTSPPLANSLYIHESIITTNRYVSYISSTADYTQTSSNNNFKDIQMYDYDDINKYIDNEITIFYNTFSNNPNATDANGKNMLQRYLDIISMQSSFSKIIKEVNTYYLGTDAYDLYKNNNKIKLLRNKIDTNMTLMNNNDGPGLDNKMNLDSTIYSAVLWTILIIFMLFYLFTNM